MNTLESQLQELKDKIECWREEAMDATKGKYGPTPKGKPEYYWRGRWDALNDLAAFLPTLGNNYVHRSELQLVVGALDSLGVVLADHEHQWTEGERAIYEQAIAICKDEPMPPQDSQ